MNRRSNKILRELILGSRQNVTELVEKYKVPVTLGHEFSGIVEEVGPDVKELKVGDRVTSETRFKNLWQMYLLQK